MFEEMARLKFFIPKPFLTPKYKDKFPHVVMESVSDDEKNVIGKFREERHAKVFLDSIRKDFIKLMKEEMLKTIEEVEEDEDE